MNLNLSPNDVNLHQGLIEDLERRLGVRNLAAWMENEAERLAALGISETVWNVAFSNDLLNDRGIVDIVPSEIASDARILPVDVARYRILYKKGLPNSAPFYPRRFAIAHEIGHTYWFAPNTKGVPLSPVQRRTGHDPTIEILCNRFAASLLLPKTRILRAIDVLTKGNISILPLHFIPVLSDYFKVAERAIVQRLFFYMETRLRAVVCLRSRNFGTLRNPSDEPGWISSWCAFPRDVSERETGKTVRIPLAHPRVIPSEMVPELPFGVTIEEDLDPRWWEAIDFVSNEVSRRPFSRLKARTSRPSGFACRTAIKTRGGREERIYLGLPSI